MQFASRVVCTLFLIAAIAPAAYPQTANIPPTVFAAPEDTNNDDVFTQFFNIASTNEDSVEDNGGSGVDRRAILEFDLDVIPSGATITGANLQWSVNTANAGPVISLSGYIGDGVAQLGDATIGSVLIPALPNTTGGQSFNVTTFIQSQYGTNRWAGFNVRDTTAAVNGRYAIRGTGPGPALVVTYTLPAISIGNATAAEGNTGTTPFTFPVTLSAMSSQTVTVSYTTVSGSAVGGTDYVSVSGSVTFVPGDTSEAITVDVNGDTVNEANETFTVTLNTPTNATIADGSGLGTINNDDPFPSLAINSVALPEGNSGTTSFVFTVTLTGPTEQPVAVDYFTTNGAATAPSDYTAASGTLTFSPGVTTRTITVSVIGDAIDETNETFTVNINNPVNAVIGTPAGLATITDDDPPPSFAISNATLAEGNAGTTSFIFNVTKSGATALTSTVAYATSSGTAVSGTDFAATSGTLTFLAGDTVKTVTVLVNGDVINEPNETFFVTLSSPTNATISQPLGTGNINNDDPAPTLAINNVTQAEGTSGTTSFVFTVTLTGPTEQSVSVNYATANGTATGSDYIAASGTLTFAPGVTTNTVTVNVSGDAVNEANETFFVNLSAPSNATITTATGTGTINNDDPAPTLAISNVTQAEGTSGTTSFVFTVTLTGPTEQSVSVNYATANGTATGSDYIAASGTLTFAPGVTTNTITVNVSGDAVNEADETFSVNLSAPSNATITTATGTGTINNDDPVPTLAINNVTQAEGNSGTTSFVFTVTLTGPTEQTVTALYASGNGTATTPLDYGAASGTVTFLAGQTSQTITVLVNGDVTNELNETFSVTLSSPSNATIATPTGTGTINNDDPLPTLAINNVTQAEGNSGPTSFVFTVTLTGATEQIVTVAYATADGTATAPLDYSTASGALSFAPGVTTNTVTVNVTGDATNETSETFTVNLSAPVNATIATATGTGTISNDDPLPTLAINNVTQAEGDSGSTNFVFMVSLTGPTEQTVTVNYATADGTATSSDYTSASGTLTFAPGVTSNTVSVPVSGDTPFEANETFTVNLTAPVNATIATATGTGTITNDDAPVVDLALTGGSTGATVGNPATYTFTIQNLGPDNASGVTLSVTLPAGHTFASAANASCSGTSTLACIAAPITAGSSVIVTITVSTTGGGTYTANGTVSAVEADPTPSNNSATATVTITGATTLMVTTTANSGNGSLRQAILDANNGVCAPCTIGFNVTTPTIPVATPLPGITATNLTIDGLTQPGIVIDGGSCLCGHPLTIGTSGVLIRGLTFQNFTGAVPSLMSGLPQATNAPNPSGIVVVSGTGNVFTGNTLQYPDGIDLGGDGQTANDGGDADSGANNLQNTPVITSAVVNGSQLTLKVDVDSSSVPGTGALRLEVFQVSGAAAIPIYTGCLAGNNLVNQFVVISPTAITAGDLIAATATSYSAAGCAAASDGTSELSAAIAGTSCALPPPAVTASGPTTFCTGGSVTLTAPSGFSAYSWSTGAITQSITVSTSGSYTVTVTDIATCTATSAPVTVTVNPLPVATISASGPTTFCAGGSVTLTASSGAAYLWSTGATSPSITVIGSGAYSVTVTSAAGCSNTSAPTNVTVNPLPTVVISGATMSCDPGSAITLTASGTNIATYLWSTGASTQSITVGPTSTTPYSVTVTSSAGCIASTTQTVAVGSGSSVAINAPATIVAGGTGNASIVGMSTGAFTWTISNGTIDSGQGTPSITFTAGTPGSVTLNASTISGSCNVTGSAIVTVVPCTTDVPALTAPGDGATGLDSPVRLTWTAVTGATGYEVYVSQNNGADSLVANTTDLSTVPSLPSGTFRWYVIARQPQGCTTLLKSATRTFTIKPVITCPAAAPSGLSPSAGMRAFSPVTLSWNGVEGATGYRVILTRAGGAVDDLGITGKDRTSVLVPVIAGDYTWEVFALYDGCPGVSSGPAAFTVDAEDCSTHTAATLVAPGQNINATSATIDFSWQSVQGADGYRVWTSVNGGDFKAVGETADLTLTATIENGRIEWYVETLFEGCASTESSHRFFTVPAANNCGTTLAPTLIGPAADITTSASRVTFSWSFVGALQYELYIAVGNGTPILATRTSDTSFTTEVPRGGIDWYVTALFNGCPALTSAPRRFTYEPPVQCSTTAPQLIAPLDDTAPIPSPVSFRWSAVPGATSYRLTISIGGVASVINTQDTSAESITVASGVGAWTVEAIFGSTCPVTTSSARTLVVVPPASQCGDVGSITLAGPSQISSSVPYSMVWRTDRNATDYTLQEATNGAFSDAVSTTIGNNVALFTRTNATDAPITLFYRVRGLNTRCTPTGTGPWSEIVMVVVLPGSGSIDVEAETSALISQTQKIEYTIPLGRELAGLNFTATPNRPWLTVSPMSGVVPAAGTLLTVTADAAALPLGTNNGGVLISFADAAGKGRTTHATSKTTPVSVNLVTPVVPNPKSTPPPDALIIPAVAHADGINSKFESDVRITNTSPQVMRYQLTFTPTGETGITQGRQTTIDIEPGRTVAMDNVLQTWFGTGSTNALGTLEIRPLTKSSNATSSAAIKGLSNFVTFASSRTFNTTPTGTFGQYIPAIPFANFVGGGSDLTKVPVLSLQQISQSAAYRTNLGFVEGSGTPANLLVSVFGENGRKMKDFQVALTGGQHLQMGSALAQQGLSVNDGRIEVRVLSSGGKVTAYASVLDNKTNDSLLVTPVTLGDAGSTKYVLLGVAELSGGIPWQTDMRLFNTSSDTVDATLTLQPLNGPQPLTAKITLAPNETRQLDRVLMNLFGVTNDGGALHVETTKATNLIATARTYRPDSSGGTFGQFISAVTPNEGIAMGSRPLQILQVEQTDRYRSNIGLAEMTGKPVVVEITAVPPDSKANVTLKVPMEPNQFRQLNSMLAQMGLQDTFNVRVTVKVVEGDGRVTAYASVVDNQTADPTFVPAQ